MPKVNSNSNPEEGSITDAIKRVATDDLDATRLLWQRFFERLCAISKPRIYDRHRRYIDPEDVAGSAMYALLEDLKQGNAQQVRNRDELWHLAVTIATRKAANKAKFFDRQKRGGKRIRGGSAFDKEALENLDQLQTSNDPAKLVEFQMTCGDLLAALPDDDYREIALMRMAGFSNQEIGNKLECSTRTVERKLIVIRNAWQELDEKE